MLGSGLIQTLQTFVTGPVAYALAAFGAVKLGASMMSGEHRGHGAGAALIGSALALWSLRFVTFIQGQS